MSHWTAIKTKIRDMENLKSALKLWGIKEEDIRVAKTGEKVNVRGYQGMLTDVDIGVRSQDGSYEFGFRLEEDGNYSVVVDEYGMQSFTKRGTRQNSTGMVTQAYSYETAKKALEERGFYVDGQFEQNEEGAVQLVATRWV